VRYLPKVLCGDRQNADVPTSRCGVTALPTCKLFSLCSFHRQTYLTSFPKLTSSLSTIAPATRPGLPPLDLLVHFPPHPRRPVRLTSEPSESLCSVSLVGLHHFPRTVHAQHTHREEAGIRCVTDTVTVTDVTLIFRKSSRSSRVTLFLFILRPGEGVHSGLSIVANRHTLW
jgi:hypothetical protein